MPDTTSPDAGHGMTAPVQPEPAAMCPRLPSSDSAHQLVQGNVAALPYVIRDVIGRAILIGGGIYLLGDVKGFSRIARNALAGAAFIETFVLLWIWKQARAHNGQGV